MERKLIAAAVSSALVLPMAAQAVEFSVSGHINRAIVSVDGGPNDGEVQHKDANSSQTRFRFTGSEELENGITAGVQLEYGLATNVRHANVYLNTAGGKITVGHASVATDGMHGAKLGGASWLGGVTNWCSYHSKNAAGDTATACFSNDGGRQPVLKYDTPALGPANIAVSAGNNDYWDVQVKIGGSFGDAGYDIRIGHIAEHDGATTAAAAATNQTVRGSDLAKVLAGEDLTADDDGIAAHEAENGVKLTRLTGNGFTDDDLLNKHTPVTAASTAAAGDLTTASAAVNFGQGTAIAVSWSQDDLNDGEYQYMEIDHSYGAGSVGVYYKTAERGTAEGSLWGVGVGHGMGGGATAYAGYRQISEDGMEDVDLIVAGMRVTFN